MAGQRLGELHIDRTHPSLEARMALALVVDACGQSQLAFIRTEVLRLENLEERPEPLLDGRLMVIYRYGFVGGRGWRLLGPAPQVAYDQQARRTLPAAPPELEVGQPPVPAQQPGKIRVVDVVEDRGQRRSRRAAAEHGILGDNHRDCG